MIRCRRTIAAVMLGAAALTSCRSPGNPPHHPREADYRDLIRRETDTSTSALASAALFLRLRTADRITGTYAKVGLAQAADDLSGVLGDLRQITPPPDHLQAQTALARVVSSGRTAITNTPPDPVAATAKTVAAHLDALTEQVHKLEPQLGV